MDRRKIMLSLTDEALTVLSEHATERKRGELVSKAILAYISQPQQETGILERIEQRLGRIEAMLATDRHGS